MINDKPYGALITGGLGYDSSIMLTSFFSLITVEVSPIPPEPQPQPPSGGSGGGVPFGGLQPYVIDNRKLVKITVKLSKEKFWVQEYIVSDNRADIIVKVMNAINRFTENVSVKIGQLKNRLIKVATTFKRTK